MSLAEEYEGPQQALERYAATATAAGLELEDGKHPHTTHAGRMTSFIDEEGRICLRLAEDDRQELMNEGGQEVRRYGELLPDFASLPDELAEDDEQRQEWFVRSLEHVRDLPPKDD